MNKYDKILLIKKFKLETEQAGYIELVKLGELLPQNSKRIRTRILSLQEQVNEIKHHQEIRARWNDKDHKEDRI